VIQGPARLVIQDLQLAANAQLTIDTTDGRVDLYVTRNLDLAAGSYVSMPGENPGLVTLQVPGELATPGILAAEGPFYGIVYAPESTLEVSPSFEVFGALIADLLTLSGPLQLHYDRYLASLSNVSAVPSLWSWRIVEISNGSVADPYQVLGVTRATLRQPSLAHADQALDIVYVDLADVTQTYSGPESGFDWALVKRTITVSRDNEPVPPAGVRSRISIDMMVQ
jgi:hypothetical protein